MDDLRHLALPGALIAVRATPRAARDRIAAGDGTIRVWVTAPPEDGRANRSVRKLLAGALGIAPTRLTLVRGETGRDKLFRVD